MAVAAGTGDVLMSRLREGRANTARGAAHFLRETVGRVRYAGANGRLTLRADSGFYTHGVVSVCRKMDVRFSITIRQHKSLRNLIEAIPEEIGLMKQPTIKQVLLLFGLPVIGSVAGNVVYEHLITPAIPFLPRVPFILYSIFATAFAVLFLLGLIAATGQAFTKGWKLVTNNELRDDVRENIRRWPTSKWDLLPVIATTYFVATMLPMVALMVVLPEGRLAGIVSQEEFAEMFLLVLTPMMLIFFVMMARWAFEAYWDMKQRWVSGTRRERYTFAATMAFVVVASGFMMGGEVAGWDDLLWTNST